MISARYRKGRTSEQIASGSGRKPSAVRMLLQRLRERLRACVSGRLAAASEV
jgi:DNA-directed RNA polymerase specialized sigma24 family protein